MTKAKTTLKLPLTEGPLFYRIFLFALPIMATGILQVLYSMADNIVVGRFSGDENALGAVGSTSSLTNLLINLLLGIAAGASVVIAQAYGARQEKVVSRAVHTALSFSLMGGLVFMAIALIISRPALILMGTEPNFLPGAILYYRIIAIGIPASAVYNFGAAVLRSVGDSKTPLIILASTGLANVGLNFLFVMGFNMSVEGVAIATIVSQYLSAIVVIAVLISRGNECYGFSFGKICIDGKLLSRILRFGVPSGIQSSLFSVSNIILTSSINSLATLPQYGKHVVTAYTISGNIDALTYITCNSFHHAAMTFTGQNYGAQKYDRIKKVLFFSLIQVVAFGISIAQLELLFGQELSLLYIDSALSEAEREHIIALTMEILTLLLNTYFICGVMDVLSGVLKGLGYAVAPMIMSLSGICGFRIFWVYAVFPSLKTPSGLLLSYPLSWSLTAIMFAVTLTFAWFKLKRDKRRIDNTAKEKDTVEV